MREAPSRVVIAGLAARGASLRLYDPIAMAEAKGCLEADLADAAQAASRLSFCTSQAEALEGADALIIVTEWKSFRSPDFGAVRALLKHPVIFDGRNLFEPLRMKEAGFEYFAIGRSAEGPTSV
jgi:UDPglucose 6-dehydrogenase